jgi:putative ABC transport system permease protein
MMQLALVLARLRSHPGRSLVLVVVVAVASGIALSALAVLRVADDPWAPLVAATNGGDVEIDEAPARPDPRALAALPEVETVGVLIESGDAALQVRGDALLVALKRLPPREAMVIDRPLVMAGRWFAAADEVVFEVTLADTLGIRVGDTVTLNGEHGRSVRVVGTAATTMMPNYPERLPGGVFAGSALFDAVDPVGTPRWSVGLRLRDPSRADEVVARLNREGPVPSGVCNTPGWCARTSVDIRDDAFPTRIDSYAQIMLFFAVLMLVAAVLLIVTLLGSRLVSEARELTLLQVAGATPARVALLIAAEHALLAAVGTAAGILVAGAVGPRIAESAAPSSGRCRPGCRPATSSPWGRPPWPSACWSARSAACGRAGAAWPSSPGAAAGGSAARVPPPSPCAPRRGRRWPWASRTSPAAGAARWPPCSASPWRSPSRWRSSASGPPR